jgi:hypothetical protein
MSGTDISMIAPCGMNCGICLAHMRDRNRCMGCWSENESKPYHCSICSIRLCENLLKTDSKFCYDCTKFPCTRLKQLDKRYRLKYNMSMIENLASIAKIGLENFIQTEHDRWKCNSCGSMICVHTGNCLKCDNQNYSRRKTRSIRGEG